MEKILIGGEFTDFNGNSCGFFARLNKNGSYDNSFNSDIGFDDFVNSIVYQDNGFILVLASFAKYKTSLASKLCRIKVTGELDVEFSSGTGANDYVSTIEISDENSILIGGNFTNYNGLVKKRIAKFAITKIYLSKIGTLIPP